MKVAARWIPQGVQPKAEKIVEEFSTIVGEDRHLRAGRGVSENSKAQYLTFDVSSLNDDGNRVIGRLCSALFDRYRIIPDIYLDEVKLLAYATFQEARIEELEQVIRQTTKNLPEKLGPPIPSSRSVLMRANLNTALESPLIKKQAPS